MPKKKTGTKKNQLLSQRQSNSRLPQLTEAQRGDLMQRADHFEHLARGHVLIMGQILPPKDARWPSISDGQFQVQDAEEVLQVRIEEIQALRAAL